MNGHIAIFITASNETEAEKISKRLVTDRLVACANIASNVRSIYRWKGVIEDEKEVLIIAKGRIEQFDRIVKTVKEVHSYDVPEVIAIPIIDGNPEYLTWIDEETADIR